MFDTNEETRRSRGRAEVRSGVVRRRRWTAEEKGRVVAQAVAPGAVFVLLLLRELRAAAWCEETRGLPGIRMNSERMCQRRGVAATDLLGDRLLDLERQGRWKTITFILDLRRALSRLDPQAERHSSTIFQRRRPPVSARPSKRAVGRSVICPNILPTSTRSRCPSAG
jgi:hypothetical protein